MWSKIIDLLTAVGLLTAWLQSGGDPKLISDVAGYVLRVFFAW